jgi:hypothetical protein
LWFWLLDNCDNAGVVDASWRLASFQIGLDVGPDDVGGMGGRVVVLETGKLFIPKFVGFQFGKLSSESRVHQSVLRIAEQSGVIGKLVVSQDTLSIGYPEGTRTPKRERKDKDKYKEGGCGGKSTDDTASRFTPPTLDEVREAMVGHGMPASRADAFMAHYGSNGWMVGKVKMKDWRKAVVTWKVKWEAGLKSQQQVMKNCI